MGLQALRAERESETVIKQAAQEEAGTVYSGTGQQIQGVFA